MSYEFDTRPLEALKQRNYLMSVFECLHPKGVIPARASVPVQFVFSPLEAKRYTVSMYIKYVVGAEKTAHVAQESNCQLKHLIL